MLTLRQRGGVFYVRGTVKLGKERRTIAEHSTGARSRDEAEAYSSKLEGETRLELLLGRTGRPQTLTVRQAGELYMRRPGGLAIYDVERMAELDRLIGGEKVADAQRAFGTFVAKRCAGLAPATVDRYRSVLQAAVNYAARVEDFPAPRISLGLKIDNRRIRYLSDAEQEALLAAYTLHVRPIAVTLCFQGLRTGEALRLDWRDVNWHSDSLFVRETKSGVPRSTVLHPRTRAELHRLFVGQGSPAAGRVFLNRLGAPYSDPRTYASPGGNPLKRAHETACRRAGVSDFRVHDWRHHWASQCVMAGIDLETIRQEGGWQSLRMVEKYAAVSANHRREAMRRRR